MYLESHRAAAALFTVAVIVSVSACTFVQPAHHVTETSPSYDPAVSSRIRFLTGNGTKSTSFRPNSVCYRSAWENDPDAVRVDDGYLAAWKYSSHSVTIGMSSSPRPFMRVEGLNFKDMIKEYVVEAGKPLTISSNVQSSTGTVSYSCSPPAMTFTPVAGQDYDVFQDSNGRQCWLSARRIDGHGMDEPVKLLPASKCPEDDAVRAARPVKTGP